MGVMHGVMVMKSCDELTHRWDYYSHISQEIANRADFGSSELQGQHRHGASIDALDRE
jgi:hypothetical protein